MRLAVLERLLIQRLLDILQQCRNGLFEILELNNGLFAGVAANQYALTLSDIARTNLQTKRNALHLVLGKLPTRGIVAQVDLGTDARCFDLLVQLGCLLLDAFLVSRNRNNNQLGRSDTRRQNQTLVITVRHDDRADDTGRNAPGGLIHILQGVVLIGVLHAECACKAVTEVVRGTGLQSLAVVHHSLDGVGILCTGEALLLGLFALNDRNGQPFLEELRVDVQHAQSLFHSLLSGSMNGMTLLPPELTAAQERTGGLFPADNRAPLVVQLRQIAPGANDLCVMLAEQRLRSRTNAQTLLQLVVAAVRYPCTLRREAFNVVGFLLQQAFRNENRHCYILVTGLLEHTVQRVLDVLPQRLCVRTHDDTALYRRIIGHFSLFNNICVPLREVHVHGRDLADQLFLFCHYSSPFWFAIILSIFSCSFSSASLPQM